MKEVEEPTLKESMQATSKSLRETIRGLFRRRPEEEEPVKAPMRRLLGLLAPYKGRVIVALLGVIVGSALGLGAQWMIKPLINAIVPGGDPSMLELAAVIMLGLFGLQAVISFFNRYLIAVVGVRVVMGLRLRLVKHLQRQSLSFYNDRRTGELVSRVMNDVDQVHGTMTNDLAGLFGQIVSFFGALVLIVHTEWRLTLMMFLMVPTVSLVSTILGRIVRKLSTRVTDEYASLTTVLEESIRGVRVVRSFVREAHIVERFRTQLGEVVRFVLQRIYLTAIFDPIMSFLFAAAIVLLIWYAGQQVLAGRMDAGALVMYISLTSSMAGSIRWVGGLWSRVQSALGATQRLFELLDTEPDMPELRNAPALPPVKGGLAFEEVSFAYHTSGEHAPKRLVLDQITLDVAAGETLALVGPSGAGKTTLINLIPRFYDPVAGAVRLDGVDIRSVSLNSLREQIGIVAQDPHLFAGTIRDNILFGRLDASEEDMIAAAKAANAHEFILAQSEGYDTKVGEQGVKLSGGQRQRIAIARVILKDPRMLLLDEATSALDSESEQLVQEAMERLMKGRTAIVIAHRLSTVKNASRIAVLDAGRLIELGTHEDLMQRGGLYAQLYRRQFRDGDLMEMG